MPQDLDNTALRLGAVVLTYIQATRALRDARTKIQADTAEVVRAWAATVEWSIRAEDGGLMRPVLTVRKGSTPIELAIDAVILATQNCTIYGVWPEPPMSASTFSLLNGDWVIGNGGRWWTPSTAIEDAQAVGLKVREGSLP